MIGFVKLRILEPDDQCVLRGDRLKEAMMEDIENGLYPFFVSTTLGTTGCCAFDRLDEIGPVCKVCRVLWPFNKESKKRNKDHHKPICLHLFICLNYLAREKM